ncbi:MAG: hypothetical protein DLM61_27195 [Pseudonocardiales bacterium]|nr:hypothetical protein [Pseudonocardiales bacterium]PZS21908.1 MAG: hypothetical protein DLM61_27195 [Pseudonocardiales bacterium]
MTESTIATIALSRSRLSVALCLAVVGAVLLGLKAVVALGFAGISDVFALVVVVVAVLAAGSVLAAVITTRRAPKLSRMLVLAALAGSVVVDPALGAILPGVPVFLLAIAAGLMCASPQAPASEGESGPTHDHPGWAVALGWLGIALHVAVALLYAVAAQVVPFYGPVLFLWGVWVGLWAALQLLACRLLRDRPIWTPLAPLAAVGLWFEVVSLQTALGWLP